MINVQKIKQLAKKKGISFSFLCSSVGMGRGYLNDAEAGKTKISVDRLKIMADILGTTPAYLQDETNNPSPNSKTNEIFKVKNPADRRILELLSEMSDDEREKVLIVLKAMIEYKNIEQGEKTNG